MAKSKGKHSRKKGGQIDEVIHCPHLHFKTDVIDRNVLSKEQHLNLLSTPKGYRWEEYKNEGVDGGPAEESPARRIMCSGRRMKKAEKVYVHNFLAEVWNLLTPEMVDRLKGMLMNEFGMSPQGADDFIRKQREENITNSSTVSFYKKPRDIGDGKYVHDHVIKKRIPNKAQCDQSPKSNLGVRNSWIKGISDHLSDLTSSYVVDTMCSERTERQQEIALTLLNRFNTLLEQKTSISNPQTTAEKTIVLLADRLALWLDKNVAVSKVVEKRVARKLRLEKLRKARERKEADENAKMKDAQYLAGEEQALKGDEKQAKGLTEEEGGRQVAEDDHEVESLIDEEEDSAEAGNMIAGVLSEGTDGLLKKETDQDAAGKEMETGDTELADQKEKEEREAAEVGMAEAAEMQKEEEDPGRKVEDQEAPADHELEEKEEVTGAKEKGEADIDEGETEQQKGEVERQEEEGAAPTASEDKADDELKEKEDTGTSETDKVDVEGGEAEKNTAGKQNLENELMMKNKDEEDGAAAAASAERQDSEIEHETVVKDASEAQLSGSELKEKEVDRTSEELLKMAENDQEEAEKEAKKEAAEAEKLRLLGQLKREEEDERLANIANEELEEYENKKGDVLPDEIEKITKEVLSSVASIILETKIDPTPRQEAIRDIMTKHLEENLGDEDKEVIDRVASKAGTWIDKIVDQASQEYGERESRGQLRGVPSKLGDSRGWEPGVGQTLGRSVGVQDGFGLGRIPGDILGSADMSGPIWISGGHKAPSSILSTREGTRYNAAGIPVSRTAPVSQRPKGGIYRVSRSDSGYHVNIISNTRARGKIRLARGKSPAYENIPNPDGPMEPSDVKSWYKWTSALAEVAESWADWIKDTIKQTQQKGEQLSRDNCPDRMKEWNVFKEDRAQGARKWGQTKKEMEDRANQWSKKGRKIRSQEANKFLRDQEKLAASAKPKSKKTLMNENQCDSATPMMVKNYLRKMFADITANEIEERIIQAICGRRSKQEVDVSQRLLKILADITGEHCTLHSPSNGTQRILVFTADQIAIWLINNVDIADKAVLDRREKRLDGIEDGGKGDGKADDEEDAVNDKPVQIIHRKKRPSGMDNKAEGSGDGVSQRVMKKEPKKSPAATTSKKPGQETSASVSAERGSNKRTAKKRSGDDFEDSKDRDKTSRDQKQRGGSSEKGATGKDKEKKNEGKFKTSQSQAKAKGASESGRGDAAKGSASGSKPTAGKEASGTTSSRKLGPKPPSSQSKTDGATRKSPQTSPSQAVRKTGATQRTSTSDNKRASGSRRGSKSAEQRPRTVSEQHREHVGEMISSHISGLIKDGSMRKTPRAEALQDVISKKLVGSNMPLDQQALDAIKDASVLLAAYIDKQAENVELEYGVGPPPQAIAQRGKGVVFSVKPAQSSFAVSQVTHYDAAQKVAESRGRPKPGAITLSKGGFNPKEGKEWARWANDVVSMADKWSKWIDSTVSTAVASAEKKKAGQDVEGWREWKKTAGEEALEWRRNKKLLSQSAALFLDKVDRTKKPQSVPTQGTSQPSKNLQKKK